MIKYYLSGSEDDEGFWIYHSYMRKKRSQSFTFTTSHFTFHISRYLDRYLDTRVSGSLRRRSIMNTLIDSGNLRLRYEAHALPLILADGTAYTQYKFLFATGE